ncbi:DNA-binding response regulator [Paenibacillus sp. FSL H8-0548]|uniref:response regulator n=1 Tax=Paenibacillus sp. FSL H8-0548 TaxID=1920422 RepID=UPI00096C8DD8|nr:response regulator [Paenibacillus sp. FSL H8-0548]OMF19792.1 DNA-binding response regulator [Paenibacillus sp. FSL H8-0548]
MQLHSAILVDDEVYTRKGLMKLIDWEACGFQIVGEADNGEDALELIKRVQPALVITDIRMPVIDGLELIRQITMENIVSPTFIIMSGYNDFNYAQQAMRFGVHDFVVKPIDDIEFSQILTKLNEKLKLKQDEQEKKDQQLGSEMIKLLILGEASDALIAEWEQRLNLWEAERLYYLFAELNDNHRWQPAEEQISNAAFKALVQRELVRVTGAEQPICLHEHRNRIGILVPSFLLAPFNGDLERFMIRLRTALDAHLGSRVFLYAGTPVHRLSEIRESYKAAKEATLYKYIQEDKRIVISDRIQSEQLNYIGLDPVEFSFFMEHMEEMQLEAVNATVDKWFQDFREKRYAPEAVKMNIQQCLMGIMKTIRSMEGDEQSLLTLRPLLNWQDTNLSLGELKKLFLAFLEESQQCIGVLRKEQSKGDIHKIKSYIEANYSQNISLKSIAALFYVNPVYLGQLFKKTYGTYFNEFLLQLRVSEAKKLLRQSLNMRIYEIAEKVGFSTADYFVTQFEKLEHMTPTEYRNKLK